MSEEVAEFRERMRGYAAEKVTDEPIEAASLFRRWGEPTARGVPIGAAGLITWVGMALFRKRRESKMPDYVLLVATATKVRAFAAAIEGQEVSVGDEVALWDRNLLLVGTARRAGVTLLTLESPGRSTTMTVAPLGTYDDAVSLEFGQALTGGAAG